MYPPSRPTAELNDLIQAKGLEWRLAQIKQSVATARDGYYSALVVACSRTTLPKSQAQSSLRLSVAWTRPSPHTSKPTSPCTHFKTRPRHKRGEGYLGSLQNGSCGGEGSPRWWLPHTPGLRVVGHVVTQGSAGRLFGRDNDRAAAGVSAQTPRGPLPCLPQGKQSRRKRWGPSQGTRR